MSFSGLECGMGQMVHMAGKKKGKIWLLLELI